MKAQTQGKIKSFLSCAVFLAAGALIFLQAYNHNEAVQRLRDSGVQTRGSVMKVTKIDNKTNDQHVSYSYQIEVEFSDLKHHIQSAKIDISAETAASIIVNGNRFELEGPIDLLYEPSNPANVFVAGDSIGTKRYGEFYFALGFILLGVTSLYFGLSAFTKRTGVSSKISKYSYPSR